MANKYDPRAVAIWSRYRELINRAELARQIGISPVSIHNWRVVPEGRVHAVSKVLGVPADRLRPDLAPYLDPWED